MLDAASLPEKIPGKPRKVSRKPRKSHLLVMLGSLAAGIATAVTALDSWQKVLVDLGLRKDESFVLAEQSARGELARQIVRGVSSRDFWVVRYAGAVTSNFPAADQDDAWKHYSDSVVAWNQDYMMNFMLVGKYFGAGAAKRLADIHWQLRGLNTCLNKVHYSALYTGNDAICHVNGIDGGAPPKNLDALNKATAALDKDILMFVQSLAD
jgi:hypothetical protein